MDSRLRLRYYFNMRLIHLKTKGFRNLKNLSLEFSPKKSLFAFVGQNGQGKTNILEAMYICGLSKSFRNANYDQWVGWNQPFCDVQVGLGQGDEIKTLQVIAMAQPRKQKALKINGVKTPAMEFIGQLKVVFFSPDDLAYMGFAPKWRRRYLDVLLSQLSSDYLKALSRYQSILKQRNALLKNIRDGLAQLDELDLWDEQLAAGAMQIYEARDELIADLVPLLQKYYQAIAHHEDHVEVELVSTLSHANEKECLEHLRLGRTQDVGRGMSQFGPHRDDLEFRLNGQDMATFASRGEWRSMVLGLKFAEVQIIKQKTGQSPIVLLDDVFSELDEDRQRDLLGELSDEQIFLTTTHQSFLEGVSLPMEVFGVKEGGVNLA